ncbi:helix-turn-helix domain-containing protein [Burkholderia gladioli]|uniref:helix-turn-helix domain-containing protein n=1 Tax=Burkholderia gladioli TaxID=28095 RepID=UPI001FC80971|nr:helix-turn-helix domain-containing protein [Burkholderia gladioli]
MSIAQKAVLISLADNANDQGVCWPSIPTIAKRVCASERAVQNAIKWLEEAKIVTANRTNGRHTSYTLTPAAYLPQQEIHPRSKCTGEGDAPQQEMHHTPAGDAGDPRTACTTPPHQMPSNRQEPPKEPSWNRQPARRTPRVALHAELQAMELPEWLAFDVWDMWCEHREAKAKDAPWSRPAAIVSLRKLEKLRASGQDPRSCVEEAVLRGWTGLFPVKGDVPAAADGQHVPADWWKTNSGIVARGEQLKVERRPDESELRFKARVFKAAGPGEWMEEMLRSNKGSESLYQQLYAYFNDVPRESAEREAA